MPDSLNENRPIRKRTNHGIVEVTGSNPAGSTNLQGQGVIPINRAGFIKFFNQTVAVGHEKRTFFSRHRQPCNSWATSLKPGKGTILSQECYT
jgi:hypothetical protein